MITYWFLGYDKVTKRVKHEVEITREEAIKEYKAAGISAADSLDATYPISTDVVGRYAPDGLVVEAYDWFLDPVQGED